MRNRSSSVRKRTLLAGMALTMLFVALGASSAMAGPKGEFVVFAECPTSNPSLSGCISARAEGGSITFGKQTVPVVKTQVLQGGFIENELGEFTFVGAATEANTLPPTPQKVPGGLSGLVNCTEITNKELREACEAVFENKLTGVYATIELAAPASQIGLNETNLLLEEGTALQLPVKVKIENPLLGGSCYLGSNAHPIVVPLTTGTSGTLKGKLGTISSRSAGEILVISNNSLVNNTIEVPGATGCGAFGLLNGIVNSRLGLPAAAGKNKVTLNGMIEQTGAEAAREHE